MKFANPLGESNAALEYCSSGCAVRRGCAMLLGVPRPKAHVITAWKSAGASYGPGRLQGSLVVMVMGTMAHG